MAEFVAQVFDGPAWITQTIVEAETWQAAHKIVQGEYPGMVVSVHSLDVYREVVQSCPHRQKGGYDE